MWVADCKHNIQSWPLLPGSTTRASGGPTGLRLRYVSRVLPSHPARCYWLRASHHCPKVDAQKRPKHSKIRKSRQRAESLQIQKPPHTSSGSYLPLTMASWPFSDSHRSGVVPVDGCFPQLDKESTNQGFSGIRKRKVPRN